MSHYQDQLAPAEGQKDEGDHDHHSNGEVAVEDRPSHKKKEVSNEYVLNVAFYSFVAFMALEAVFAVIAGSKSMLEDAEAMSVDALTYLFNLCAERIKKRPYTQKELEMSTEMREYNRELHRLYLELIPPLISVTTLIIVTVLALQDSIEVLRNFQEETDAETEDVSVNLMFIFSALNLLLDIVNVVCFARAEQAFGLYNVKMEHSAKYYMRDSISSSTSSQEVHRYTNEKQHLLYDQPNEMSEVTEQDEIEQNALFVNLNMCSAWTHVCADTLRSTAVLIAASIAYIFNESVSGLLADTVAAIVVSIIILISLVPLLQGLVLTFQKIVVVSTDPSRPM